MARDRSADYAREKIVRQQRKEAGICTRCGAVLTDAEKADKYTTCTYCRQHYTALYYPKDKVRRPMKERGKHGDCWQCGRMLPEGYTKKKCPECIAKTINNLLQNRKKEVKA